MIIPVRRALSGARKLGVRAFLALTAVQAALVGILAALAEIRKGSPGRTSPR